MKKLLLLSTILIGAASASQAGGINLRIGFPLPTPPRLVITPPAPVVVAPQVCAEPQVAVAAPVCETPVVVTDNCRPAPLVVRDDYYRERYVYRDHRPFIAARDWHRNHRWGGHDRDDHRHGR